MLGERDYWIGVLARPALDRLRRDVAAPDRHWDEVLIYDTSRLSRDQLHRLSILEPEFKKAGVKIIYIASPIFPDNADGRFMAWQDAGMQQWFAAKAKDNMWRGLTDAVANGQCWWHPYGYEVQRIRSGARGKTLYVVMPKEPEASIVQEVFRLAIGGTSCYAIADLLNARGVPSAKGGRWSPAAIRHMIHDPYYSGTAPWARYHWVEPERKNHGTPEYRRKTKTSRRERAPDDWIGAISVPALVTPEEQEAAKARISQNRRTCARTPQHTYLLRSQLQCKAPAHDRSGPCEGAMVARTRRYPSGVERSYYSCGRQYQTPAPGGRRTCGTIIEAAHVEALVWTHVQAALVQTADLRAAYEQLQARPAAERRQWEEALCRLHAEREETQRRLRRVQELYEDGRYSDDDYTERRAQLRPHLAGLDEQIEHATSQLASTQQSAPQWEEIASLVDRLARACQHADEQTKAVVMRELVRCVEVWPDRYEIVLGLGPVEVRSESAPRHQLVAEPTSST